MMFSIVFGVPFKQVFERVCYYTYISPLRGGEKIRTMWLAVYTPVGSTADVWCSHWLSVHLMKIGNVLPNLNGPRHLWKTLLHYPPTLPLIHTHTHSLTMRSAEGNIWGEWRGINETGISRWVTVYVYVCLCMSVCVCVGSVSHLGVSRVSEGRAGSLSWRDKAGRPKSCCRPDRTRGWLSRLACRTSLQRGAQQG